MMNASWSEEELVKRCRLGEEAAWAELLHRTGKIVYGAIYDVLSRHRLSARQDIADDVYARVFCDCWENGRLAALRDPAALKSFMASTAALRTLDALRPVMRGFRRGSAGEAALGTAHDNRPGPSDQARRHEAARIVEEELAHLTEKERYILKLHVQQELSHAEIGQVLDIPRDTVSTVIRRAKEKIRQSLERKGIDEC